MLRYSKLRLGVVLLPWLKSFILWIWTQNLSTSNMVYFIHPCFNYFYFSHGHSYYSLNSLKKYFRNISTNKFLYLLFYLLINCVEAFFQHYFKNPIASIFLIRDRQKLKNNTDKYSFRSSLNISANEKSVDV